MRVDIIDDIKTFNEIEENWDAVYTADPDAHFFLSSAWLSGWLPMVAEPWFILAARSDAPDSSYVAFFPLKYVLEEQEGGLFASQLCMAGNSMADYAGLICLPGYEEEVIPAFAAHVKEQSSWSTFDIQSFLKTDRRIAWFLKYFSLDTFNFTQYRSQNQGEDTDNYIAPYLSLEDDWDWDRYLQNSVTSNTRQKIRRFLRKIDTSDEFYITHVDANNLESHIEILLRLWELKWGEHKGENCDSILAYMSNILRHCFEKNCLYFPVLWQGEKPLGAIANFIDLPQNSMLFVISGRDETCKNLPPGLILHADAIRYAIQNGFRVYDFLKGNEKYKYSFGVKERHIDHLIARYKSSQNRKLDVRTLPLAFHLTAQNHRNNRIAEAEQEYRQILETQSDHPNALYGLGVLMGQKGEYLAAEKLMKTLLQVQPNSIRALFSLGNLYQAQERLSEAIEAYHQVLALQPNQIAAYNNLGYALQQQGKWEEAIVCYQKALELQPDCLEAEVNQANALHAQQKLSPEKQAHYATLNNDLGNKCQQTGDLKTALAYYQQSISMNPDFADAQYNLDRVLQKQDEQKMAIVS